MKKLTVVSIALLFANQIFAQLPDLVSVDAKPPLLLILKMISLADGATWGVVGECNEEQYSRNLDQLLKLPKKKISLFSYLHTTKHDQNWQIEGSLEALMHKINMFHRTGVLTTVGFENSGADWLEQYKKYIEPNVIVTSPHKIWS
jgi:hypothetical protein